MAKIIIKPKTGLIIRDPKTKKPIPSEGIEVEKSSFWLRRMNDGDVEEIKSIKKPTVKAESQNKTEPTKE